MKTWKAFGLTVVLAALGCGDNAINPDLTAALSNQQPTSGSPVATCPPDGAAACQGATRAGNGGCVSAVSEGVHVAGSVQDYDTSRPLGGAIVHLIDQESGEPTGICTVSAGDGAFEMQVPKAQMVGFAVAYADAKDTYQFNSTFTTDNVNAELVSVSKVTAQLIPALVGFSPDPLKGIVSGSVVNRFANPTTEAGVPLQVRAQSGPEAHYFEQLGNAIVPATREARAALNPENALFEIFDVTPGLQSLELLFDGEVTQASNNQVFVYPDSISITHIRCTHCEE